MTLRPHEKGMYSMGIGPKKFHEWQHDTYTQAQSCKTGNN